MASSPLSYYPPEDQLAARVKLFESNASNVVDYGNSNGLGNLPVSLESPLAWSREDIEKDMNKCVLKLSESDIAALERAARNVEGLCYQPYKPTL